MLYERHLVEFGMYETRVFQLSYFTKVRQGTFNFVQNLQVLWIDIEAVDCFCQSHQHVVCMNWSKLSYYVKDCHIG